jgi:hypothetical protein
MVSAMRGRDTMAKAVGSSVRGALGKAALKRVVGRV